MYLTLISIFLSLPLPPAVSPEKAQQILEDSLQDGSIPQSFLKVLATGAARSGKTLSKKNIFKIKIDSGLSPSTGVNEAPIPAIRSISFQMVDSSLPEWEHLTQEKLLGTLALKLRRGFIRGNVAKAAEEILEAYSAGSSSTLVEASSAALPGKSQAAGAMVHALCDHEEARGRAKQRRQRFPKPQEIYKLQLILFLDSGGQPQFHEVLPALSHNICLIMLFLKLNERLDHPCSTAFTDKEGEWFDEQCPSLFTNEQMLVQLVHTMMSKPLHQIEGRRPMLMVIGTHFDLIHECIETLAQKNERLASLFLPALKEELIMNGNDIIFPVNALNPGEKDKEVFDLIRHKIADVGLALEQNTPLSWIMFQNDLIKYGEEHGKRVVSMEECQAIAGRLKMDRRGLEAALIHFNSLSIFMYIPSVLPGCVFINPQMPLDGVNTCVDFSYQVGCGKVRGLVAQHAQFWKEGIITTEMLEEEEFSSCFAPPIFTAEKALNLYQSLYIAAPLGEGKCIMPCMLPTVSKSKQKELLPPHNEHAAVLLLHFHKSRIPNGIFCATHACMRCKYGCTTCPDLRENPVCLYRNMVKLQHPSKPVQITLLHAQKHFEVHITAPPTELPTACPKIRDMLLDSVDSATSVFRYKGARATVAFLCPCSPETCAEDRHTATPTDDHYLRCTVRGTIHPEPLTASQRIWLTSSSAGVCLESCVLFSCMSLPLNANSHAKYNSIGVLVK